jgi:hypothetical protein
MPESQVLGGHAARALHWEMGVELRRRELEVQKCQEGHQQSGGRERSGGQFRREFENEEVVYDR